LRITIKNAKYSTEEIKGKKFKQLSNYQGRHVFQERNSRAADK